MQLDLRKLRFPSPKWVEGRAMLRNQENSIFTARKAIDGLIIYSFLHQIYGCLKNFRINLSSWNDYDSWFFSFLKNICLWNFEFDSRITNHKSLIRTMGDALLVGVKYVVKYIHIRIMFLMRDKFMLINNEQSLKATLAFLA